MSSEERANQTGERAVRPVRIRVGPSGDANRPYPAGGDGELAHSSYASNRETVLHNVNSSTIEETHLITNTGSQNLHFTEEHWSSEIKSYVTHQPPKFVQVIKAYRVLSTDTLTLVCEVSSSPPAMFDWFVNDRPANQDRKRFRVRHGLNISTLTVEGPEQGVYSCSASNPAGTSKTYGYVIVNESKTLKSIPASQRQLVSEEFMTQEMKEKIGQPPKFRNQVPNLTLKPGTDAVIDVEVESSPGVRFTWYVDGKMIVEEQSTDVEMFYPDLNRCIALFKLPKSGKYTVVAQNDFGAAKSTGYIEIEKDSSFAQLHLLSSHQGRAAIPAPPGSSQRAKSITKTTTRTTHYTTRSSSLPRTDHAHHKREYESPVRSYEDDQPVYASMTETTQTFTTFKRAFSPSSAPPPLKKFHPSAPEFVNQLPAEIVLNPNERLVLTVDVAAKPQADIRWNVNGFELKPSKQCTVLNEQNRSTLVIQPPVRQGRYNVTAENDAGVCQTMTVVKHVFEEILPSSRSLPEFTENVTTVVTSHYDDFDSDSKDSVETVKYNDSAQESDREHRGMSTISQHSETITTTRNIVYRIPRASDGFPHRPMVTVQPDEEVHLKAGQPLVLETQVDSNPPSTIKWYQNNFEVKNSSNVIIEDIETNHSRCTFLTPTEGYYRSVATNEHGSVTTTTRVTTEYTEEVIEEHTLFGRKQLQKEAGPVYKPVKKTRFVVKEGLPKAPILTKRFETNLRAVENQPMTLEVEADAIPEAEFAWRVNNFEVKQNQYVKIDSSERNKSRATFLRPVEGRYEVIASNWKGQDSCSSRVAIQYLDQPGPLQKGPVFVQALPVRTVITEKQYENELVVVVKTDTPGTFKWFADGQILENSSEHQIINEFNKSTLIIKKKIEKAVEYAVEYTNSYGTIHSKTTVISRTETRETRKVEEDLVEESMFEIRSKAPRFVELLSAANLLEGEQLNAHVSIAKDTEKCSFKWYLNGSAIPDNFVRSNGYESTLAIPLVTKEMSGMLLVVAENRFGVAESSMFFAVEQPPPPRTVKHFEDTMILEEKTSVRLQKEPQQPQVEQTISRRTEEEEYAEAITEEKRKVPQPKPVQRFEDTLTTEEKTSISVQKETYPGIRDQVDKTVTLKNTEEDFTETTNIQKREESYSLLVKVAEGIAQTLVAKVFVEALQESVDYLMNEVHSSDEEEQSVHYESAAETLPAPPSFQIQRETFSAVEGQNVTIHTKVYGSPMPTIAWYRDNQKIHDSNYYKIITTEGHSQLIIKNVQLIQSGRYECRAENEHGCALFTCTLIVQEPKEKREEPKPVELERILTDQSVHSTIAINRKADNQKCFATVLHECAAHLERALLAPFYQTIEIESLKQTTTTQEFEQQRREVIIRPPTPTRRFEEPAPGPSKKVKETEEEYLQKDELVKKVEEPMKRVEETQEYLQKEEQIKKIKEKTVTEEITKIEEAVPGPSKKVEETQEYLQKEELIQKEAAPVHKREIRIEVQSTDESRTQAERMQTSITQIVEGTTETTHEVFHDAMEGPQEPTTIKLVQRAPEEASTSGIYNTTTLLVVIECPEEHEHAYHVQPHELLEEIALKKLHAVGTVSIQEIITDEQKSTVMVYRDMHKADEATNIEVRRQSPTFEHELKIVEPQKMLLEVRLDACAASSRSPSITVEHIEAQVSQAEEGFAEETVGLIVHTEQPTRNFSQELTIVHSEKDFITYLSDREYFLRTGEVMQTKDIWLLDRRDGQKESMSSMFNNTTALYALERAPERANTGVQLQHRPLEAATVQNLKAVGEAKLVGQTADLTESSQMIYRSQHEAEGIVNVEIVRPPLEFDYELTIIEPHMFSLLANLLATEVTNEELVTVFAELKKQPEVLEAVLKVMTPGFEKEQVAYKWILSHLEAKMSAKDTWTMKKTTQETLNLEQQTRTNINLTTLHPQTESTSVVIGEQVSTSQHIQIQRQPSPSEETSLSSSAHAQAPTFHKRLENVTTTIGKSLTLKSIVGGIPVPSVKWFVDGDEITGNNDYELVYEDGVCLLRFKSVIAEDEGEYVCVASNTIGQAATSCFLKVTGKSLLFAWRRPLRFSLSASRRLLPVLAAGCCFRFLKLKKDLKLHEQEATSTSIDESLPSYSYSYVPSPTAGMSFFQINKSGVSEVIDVTESFIIHKYFDAGSVSRSFKKQSTLEKVTCTIAEEADSLWGSTNFDDPFHGAETVSLPVEDRFYEPRVALLPKKVLYKGQPVDIDLEEILESLTDLSQSFKTSRSTVNGEEKSLQDSHTESNQYYSSLPRSLQDPQEEFRREFYESVRTTTTTVSDHAASRPANDEFGPFQKGFSPPKEQKITVAEHNFDIFKPIIPTPPPLNESPIQKSVQSLKTMEARQSYSKPVFTSIPSQDSSLQESTTSFEIQTSFLKPQESAGITKKLSGASLEIENIMSHKPEITVPEPVQERPHIHPEFMNEEAPAPPVPPHQGAVSKDEIEKLLKTCIDVQHDLERFQSEELDSEAQRIEKAIFDISEHIALQEPVSKAQAEASEELLRTRLAEMIINLDSDPEMESDNYELLRTPIDVLKKKLENLETTLITEEEQRIEAELEELTKNRAEIDDFDEKKKALGRLSADIARMTPVIVGVRDQLSNLEGIVSDKADRNGKKSSGEANRSAIRNLFKRITDEIETIQRLCAESKSEDSTQIVIDVLTKVSQHMNAIMATVIEATVTPAPTPTLSASVHSAPGKLSSTPVSTTPAPNITTIPEEKSPEGIRKTDAQKPRFDLSSLNGSFEEKKDCAANGNCEAPTTRKSSISMKTSGTFMASDSRRSSASNTREADLPPLHRQDSQSSRKSSISQKTPPPVPKKPQVVNALVEPDLLKPEEEAITKTIVMFLSDTDAPVDLSASVIKLQKQLSVRGEPRNRVSSSFVFEKPVESNEATVTFSLCMVNMSLSQYIFDESISMQMVCEESDAGNESDNTFALCHCSVETFTPEPPIFFENDERSSFIYIPKNQLALDRDSPVKTIVEQLKKEEIEPIKEPEATVTEDFALKRKHSKLKVNAHVSPEEREQVEAAFSWNDLTVVIQQEPEVSGDSTVMTAFSYAKVCGYFSTDPTVENALVSTSFDRSCDSLTQEVLVRSTTEREKPIKSAKLSVSIIARSVHDVTAAFLEEVPWNEAHITVQTTEDHSEASSAKSNPLFNVIVSESLGEPNSHRSSQKSLAYSEKTLSSQSLAVPSYVIKMGSTASITCELNSYLPEDTAIVWYKGEEPIKIEQGKIDRISHDLLEVLVITKADLVDSDVYSLKVDNELYPVAYLIVEDGNAEESPQTEKFLSPQQTLFVMEGRTSILSCQMDKPHLKLAWYRDRTAIKENDRILMETYDDGWYRMVISDTQLSDQGTYYAFHNENFTSITLVVEEQIDEREVTVSAVEDETDDEPNDYMVPPGSTATIACELENDEFEQKLVWNKDGVELNFKDDAKREHVKNGMKHYLIIHNTTEHDSGTYSVKINDIEFRVAQITITEGTPMISGNRRKRISNNSLHSNH
ncbi:hypothetical protein QR680_003866 [Steinernema hermaphroditum]|uniref:Ig-like domain-containing protein n=1 Tax=Steinernema hermaphroditum TaxID=289476 RepID=A0AA39HLV0_9BILA|nr:hypothetical protein QR680_003866 [Steinernema hermaphroditum]